MHSFRRLRWWNHGTTSYIQFSETIVEMQIIILLKICLTVFSAVNPFQLSCAWLWSFLFLATLGSSKSSNKIILRHFAIEFDLCWLNHIIFHHESRLTGRFPLSETVTVENFQRRMLYERLCDAWNISAYARMTVEMFRIAYATFHEANTGSGFLLCVCVCVCCLYFCLFLPLVRWISDGLVSQVLLYLLAAKFPKDSGMKLKAKKMRTRILRFIFPSKWC